MSDGTSPDVDDQASTELRTADAVADRIAQSLRAFGDDVDEDVNRLATSIKRAGNVLQRKEELEFHRGLKLSSAGFRALLFVWIYGEILARDLAVLSGISRQAVSGILNTLEQDGMIDRKRRVEDDKRLAPVRVTEKGATYIEENFSKQIDVQKEYMEPLTREEIRTANALLTRLILGNRRTQ
ncbi:MarR family winged helix-turn-helix transcriptional regulator [Aeromicrobium sp. CTD01-1L150]|uniref:MarR family winged helix-turn-helix transcriptional regulator n=1 Tax=Aeromicrobium sp. CTD01-1L150 TaxID=3341830 RepID=UPI0035C23F4C